MERGTAHRGSAKGIECVSATAIKSVCLGLLRRTAHIRHSFSNFAVRQPSRRRAHLRVLAFLLGSHGSPRRERRTWEGSVRRPRCCSPVLARFRCRGHRRPHISSSWGTIMAARRRRLRTSRSIHIAPSCSPAGRDVRPQWQGEKARRVLLIIAECPCRMPPIWIVSLIIAACPCRMPPIWIAAVPVVHLARRPLARSLLVAAPLSCHMHPIIWRGQSRRARCDHTSPNAIRADA